MELPLLNFVRVNHQACGVSSYQSSQSLVNKAFIENQDCFASIFAPHMRGTNLYILLLLWLLPCRKFEVET